MTRKQEWSIATHLFNVNDRRRDSLLRNPFTLEKQKLFFNKFSYNTEEETPRIHKTLKNVKKVFKLREWRSKKAH